ncbi:MAG: hypothetical protein JF595_13360 [Sphingomonadales bacterium]|nr:hypothetical protein [Sphingomonadales bacterium]
MKQARPFARRRRWRQVPAFAPVPLRRRADGWTPRKQAAFLGALAETGSVCAAARRVGMSRETAYRLRAKPGAGSFAAAWDAVMGRKVPQRRKVTGVELRQRALFGLLKPLMFRGRHVSTLRKADNSALLRFVAQLARHERGGSGAGGGRPCFAPRSASTSAARHA